VGAACQSPITPNSLSADEAGSNPIDLDPRLEPRQPSEKSRPRDSAEVIADTGGDLVWMTDLLAFIMCGQMKITARPKLAPDRQRSSADARVFEEHDPACSFISGAANRRFAP
jgi:hypothetical protein